MTLFMMQKQTLQGLTTDYSTKHPPFRLTVLPELVQGTQSKVSTSWSQLPTCFGDVHLVQGVSKRLHQVAGEQSKEPFQFCGNAICQVVKRQQSVLWGVLCLGPIKQLKREK